MRWVLAAILALAITTQAVAQGVVLQGGPWKPGRAPMYVGQGSGQATIQDSGPAGGGAIGVGLAELGLTARGTGAPPFVAQGTGPFGTNVCDYDAPITNPTGYHYLCLSANAHGGGLLTYGKGGTAAPLPFNIIVNGQLFPSPGSISGLPSVASLSALQTLASTFAASVLRINYTAGDGSTPVVYVSSASPCSLNGGVGDGGLQVRSSDGKCWIAQFPASGVDLSDFGADGTGVVDSSAAIQAACSDMPAGTTFLLGNGKKYLISAMVTCAKQVKFVGNGKGTSSGFISGALNLSMFKFTGAGSVLRDFYINMAPPGLNTSGVALALDGFDSTADNIEIDKPCTGFDYNNGRLNISKIYVFQPGGGASCYGFRGGWDTAFTGNTLEAKISDIYVTSNISSPAQCGIAFFDNSGMLANRLDSLGGTYGTCFTPGLNQHQDWNVIADSYLGDARSVSAGILINPTDPTARVRGMRLEHDWASSTSSGPGVLIENTGVGTLVSTTIDGMIVNNNHGHGIDIEAGSYTYIVNSKIAQNGVPANTFDGIFVNTSSADHVYIQDNCLNACFNAGANQQRYGINASGAVNVLTVTGNDLQNNASGPMPLSPAITGTRVLINNNQGIDDVAQSVSISGSSLTGFGTFNHLFTTGSATISALDNGWNGRQIWIQDSSNPAFSTTTGGNICVSATAITNRPIQATWFNGCWYFGAP